MRSFQGFNFGQVRPGEPDHEHELAFRLELEQLYLSYIVEIYIITATSQTVLMPTDTAALRTWLHWAEQKRLFQWQKQLLKKLARVLISGSYFCQVRLGEHELVFKLEFEYLYLSQIVQMTSLQQQVKQFSCRRTLLPFVRDSTLINDCARLRRVLPLSHLFCLG